MACFGRRLRVVAACLLLLVSGAPIRPDEIEEQLSSMSKARVAQVLEHEGQPCGDPPGEEEVD
jgi:hypothetical protein